MPRMSSPKTIAELAYQLWHARGCPHGSEEEDWLEAERQLAAQETTGEVDTSREGDIDASLDETFPASDPPASHTSDSPPSNASEKWAAANKKVNHPG
jgi:Protein of unknown function (DUF2934)